MAYLALKPCCFAGQKFWIGEAVPAELVLPEMARRLIQMGKLAEVPDSKSEKSDDKPEKPENELEQPDGKPKEPENEPKQSDGKPKEPDNKSESPPKPQRKQTTKSR